MLCGHTFCLYPCLLPVNSNQSFVQCPFCYIETYISTLEPGTSALSTPQVGFRYTTSCPVPEVSNHPSDTNCLIPGVLDAVVTKLTSLTSARTSIQSLKTELCKISEASVSCKQSLFGEVLLADVELHYPTFYSLERAKFLVVSTYEEELARLKKLHKRLLGLKSKWVDLLQSTTDLTQDIKPSLLKELDQSTRTLIDRAKELQKSVESFGTSDLENLELNNNFQKLQYQLQNLSFVTSESENVQKQLAVLATIAKTSHIPTETNTEENWNLVLNTIFIAPLPDVTTDYDLYEYFSKFGPITSMHLMRDKSCACVTFLKVDSVRRVLETQPYILGDEEVIVRLMRKKPLEDGYGKDVDPKGIFVRDLPETTRDCDLNEYFFQFGLITSAFVLNDRWTLDSCRRGIVNFREVDAVKKVFAAQTHQLNAKQITIQPKINKKFDGTKCGLSVFGGEDDDSESEDDILIDESCAASSDQLEIFVGSLSPEVTESQLEAYFSAFGRVATAQIVRDRVSGQSRGFASVTFTDSTAVKEGVLKVCHFLNHNRLIVRRWCCRCRPEVLREEDVNPKGIFVAGLPEATTDCDLHEYFSQFGLITTVFVMKEKLKEKQDGDSRHCGLVIFLEADAVKEVYATQPHLFKSCKITVAPAKNRKADDKIFGFSVSNADYDDSGIEGENSMGQSCAGSSNQLEIYVGSLTPETTENQLKDYFSAFGSVATVRIVHDRVTGMSRGFGFVTFADNTAFKQGVLKVCHFLNGRRLRIRLSTNFAQSGDWCIQRTSQNIVPENQFRFTRQSSSSTTKTFQPEKNHLQFHKAVAKSAHVCDFLVEGLTPKITENHLWSHFAAFGVVFDVLMSTKPSQSAYIAIRPNGDPSEIIKTKHVVNGRLLNITRCFSFGDEIR